MTIPKRQHYIPRMLLDGFTDPEGWLYWRRLDVDDKSIRPARPPELFRKKYLYSIVSEAGDKDPKIELRLSQIEGDAGRVIQRMVENVRAGRIPNLTSAEMHIWYHFLLLQWRRTPETQQSVASDEVMSEMFDETVAELRAAFPERGAEIDALDTSDSRTRSIRNARAESLLGQKETVVEVLARRGIAIVQVRKPSKSFIIGSRPVVKLNPVGQTDLNHPDVQMWLPIAADIAVGVGNATDRTALYHAEDHHVRQLNLAIAKQSGIIAGRSPQLVRSLAAGR